MVQRVLLRFLPFQPTKHRGGHEPTFLWGAHRIVRRGEGLPLMVRRNASLPDYNFFGFRGVYVSFRREGRSLPISVFPT